MQSVYVFWKVWISRLKAWKKYFDMMIGLRGRSWNVTGNWWSLFLEFSENNEYILIYLNGLFCTLFVTIQ